MSNKLSPLFNSTSALLEFQIWSDATSHAIPFKSCATTGKNQFELVTASLNDVLPMRNGSTPRPLLKPLIFLPDDLYRKNTWFRTMCCLQNEPVTVITWDLPSPSVAFFTWGPTPTPWYWLSGGWCAMPRSRTCTSALYASAHGHECLDTCLWKHDLLSGCHRLTTRSLICMRSLQVYVLNGQQTTRQTHDDFTTKVKAIPSKAIAFYKIPYSIC